MKEDIAMLILIYEDRIKSFKEAKVLYGAGSPKSNELRGRILELETVIKDLQDITK